MWLGMSFCPWNKSLFATAMYLTPQHQCFQTLSLVTLEARTLLLWGLNVTGATGRRPGLAFHSHNLNRQSVYKWTLEQKMVQTQWGKHTNKLSSCDQRPKVMQNLARETDLRKRCVIFSGEGSVNFLFLVQPLCFFCKAKSRECHVTSQTIAE